MTTKNDAGPAFPVTQTICEPDCEEWQMVHSGMTLRDYFAAKAMASMIASGAVEYRGETPGQGISRNSYTMADAMLLERAK